LRLVDEDKNGERFTNYLEINLICTPKVCASRDYKYGINGFLPGITEPDEFLPNLCSFIGTKESVATKKMMKNANIPRLLNKIDFSRKFLGLRTNMSKKYFAKLINVSNIYESMFSPPFSIKNIIEISDFDPKQGFSEYFPKSYYKEGKKLNTK